MNGYHRILGKVDSALDVISACLGQEVSAALIAGECLPEGFFDLSTGVAGEFLQKLDNYRIKLAVVADISVLSSRFPELLAEEQARGRFGVFPNEWAALDFLKTHWE